MILVCASKQGLLVGETTAYHILMVYGRLNWPVLHIKVYWLVKLLHITFHWCMKDNIGLCFISHLLVGETTSYHI